MFGRPFPRFEPSILVIIGTAGKASSQGCSIGFHSFLDEPIDNLFSLLHCCIFFFNSSSLIDNSSSFSARSFFKRSFSCLSFLASFSERFLATLARPSRSEERRVGKEGRFECW